TSVDEVNVPETVAQQFNVESLDVVEDIMFNREERNRLEDALPRQKASLGGRYQLGKFTSRVRLNFYGSVEFKPTNPDLDETFDARLVVDTDLAYQLGDWRVSVGANNLFNTFPEKHENQANTSGGRFVYSRRVSQYGINGGFYYLRFQYLH
ncbi:MAG: hypothetical protein AAGC55_05800, partial [Myxococcota bacterium]